ncbi:MAG: amidase [Beijerinckiaceae bacterium]|nr:amidase [Beijerinckiaceae bacterium]
MESGERVSAGAGSDRLRALSLVEAAQAIARGEITSQALVRALIERIEAREGQVRAWASFDADKALAQARACDEGAVSGPLRGVPIGVKDVLNTFDYPTQMGSPIYDGWQSRNDASCVAMLRAAGAIVLGKTVTCEFAGTHPNVTTNPLDAARTPGGSSSGSAAAVADFMVPVALGTQTGGSVLRPASFCGVVGYKPSFGGYNREGLRFAAESIDTIGLISRTVEDAAFCDDVLRGSAPAVLSPLETTPRVGLCRTYMWDLAQAETRECVAKVAEKLEAAGVKVEEFELPARFAQLTQARAVINDVERSRSLPWEWAAHRDKLSPALQKTMQSGFAIADSDYRAALLLVAAARLEADALLRRFDVVMAPAVNGEAPLGLHYAGDPSFQALWTLLHAPSITLPAHRGPNRMPVGIQFVAAAGEDRMLLRAALWMQKVASIRMEMDA